MVHPWDRAVAYVLERSAGDPVDPALRVTLHFHPDRAIAGRPILERMRADGRYRSQFETGTSNGGLTAHAGGDRWRWESRIFGAVYDDGPVTHRPAYGSLNHRSRPAGGSPRFGSAHFRLAAEALDRATFCYPDSYLEPAHFGVARHLSGLIALADADDRAGTVDQLDDYIEAHVHGPLLLERDVEALVLDPCYRGTDVEALAAALPCEVEWHHGFRLDVATLAAHPEYRGPEIVEAGCAIAEDGILDARIIGAAVRPGNEQTLKRVWHHVARFGLR
ncbi:DUF3626 domain-containing protein [Pseudonocardia sp. TRM90224]|uniref:DUF3626 domain-containing protein n=1 Tax=Pseudonocardia sp. TRM90224 TaxID=2812678 RepID=UPI0035A95EA5